MLSKFLYYLFILPVVWLISTFISILDFILFRGTKSDLSYLERRKLADCEKYIEKASIKKLLFVDDSTDIEWLLSDLCYFFDITIKRLSKHDFEVDGKSIKIPLTESFCDSQILTASIYNLSRNKNNYYTNEDGSCLYRISNEEEGKIRKKLGKILNYKPYGASYKVLDRWRPGTCVISSISYPFFGSKNSIEKFCSGYKEYMKEIDDGNEFLDKAAKKSREGWQVNSK